MTSRLLGIALALGTPILALAGSVFSLDTLESDGASRARSYRWLDAHCSDIAVADARSRLGDRGAARVEEAARAVLAGQLQDLAFWDVHVLAGVDAIAADPLGACIAPAARDFVAAVITPDAATFTTPWVATTSGRAEGLATLAHHVAVTRERVLVLDIGDPVLARTELPESMILRRIRVQGSAVALAKLAGAIAPVATTSPVSLLVVY